MIVDFFGPKTRRFTALYRTSISLEMSIRLTGGREIVLFYMLAVHSLNSWIMRAEPMINQTLYRPLCAATMPSLPLRCH